MPTDPTPDDRALNLPSLLDRLEHASDWTGPLAQPPWELAGDYRAALRRAIAAEARLPELERLRAALEPLRDQLAHLLPTPVTDYSRCALWMGAAQIQALARAFLESPDKEE